MLEMLFNKIYVSQIISDAVSQLEVFDFWWRDMSLPIVQMLTMPNEEKSQGGAGNLTSRWIVAESVLSVVV